MAYAEIIIDISHENLDRVFTYRIPEHLTDLVIPGVVVELPFGNGDRRKKGYVIRLKDQTDLPPQKIKAILSVCTGKDTTEEKLLTLALWMQKTYGCTTIQALRTVFPVRGRVRDKAEYSIFRVASEERIKETIASLPHNRFQARIRILEALQSNSRLPSDEAKKLGLTERTMDFLEKEGLAEKQIEQMYRIPVLPSPPKAQKKQILSSQQEQALSRIRAAGKKPVLLFGITGSGKTLIYMELIEQVLSEGKQAIVLIPEISLTYQTVSRFTERFGKIVSVMNSRLSQGERFDQFRRAQSGEVRVMIGPRSALFTPFPQLGLIIIDEEHEPSYKSEHSPRYQTRETAIQRASLENASIVMGSATPSMEAFYLAQQGSYALVELSGRYEERALPEAELVDMRTELKEGNRLPLSRKLMEELEKCLDEGHQAILFLNRRGYASSFSCRSCGEPLKCPHCDVALTLHSNQELVCHYCGFTKPVINTCPFCGSLHVGGFRAGTQQIEKQVQKLYPKARVLRMDFDTTRKKGEYDQILAAFQAKEADILIGTQMIVKGHDFPEVTLVGALAADLSLNAGDYRCAERTFQLLCQAAGRAGRGKYPGKAIFQTYQPDHYSIRAAKKSDYLAFYQEELNYRSMLGYPPAAHLMAILGSSEDESRLDTAMRYLGYFVRRPSLLREGTVIGPAPAALEKVRDTYQRVLYVKHQERAFLEELRKKTEKYVEINSGFHDIFLQYDIS